jgi:AcrR family transcriptional regulator
MAKPSSGAEAAALALARRRPEIGKVRAARELRRSGIRISPSGVQAIWRRNGLATSYLRLLSRKRKADGAGAPLSDSQLSLLRRRRISRPARAQSGSRVPPRREQLIEAAAAVFNRRGYDSASLREICEAAGILPGSMYHHFRSKEDLFATVHAEGFRRINAAVDRALSGKTEPWQRIEAAIAAHLGELVKHTDVSGATGASLFHVAPAALRRRLDRDRNAYEERFRALISALDLPAEVDQSLLRLTLLGALNWTRVWYQPGKKTPEQIARHLVNEILRRRLG